MFLRKLFSGENKLSWVIVDLMIVIIGVYSAYLIQNYAEEKQLIQEKEKVLSALKIELEHFRFTMSGMSSFATNVVDKSLQLRAQGKYSDFSSWRFIEPQYSYQIIEYAVNLENTEIIDFQLYDALQELLVDIKKVEHSERLITEISMRYKGTSGLAENSSEYKLSVADNIENFERYIMFTQDRASSLNYVAESSSVALPLINERMDSSSRKKIEKKMIIDNLGLAKSEEDAVGLVRKFFPDFEESEVRELYKAYKEE